MLGELGLAGVNPIVLPERAVAEGTVWFRHGTVTEVYDGLDRATLEAGALSTERFGVQSNPAEIAADYPLVSATTRAIVAETGITPRRVPGTRRIGHPLPGPLPGRRHGRLRRSGRKLLRSRRMG